MNKTGIHLDKAKAIEGWMSDLELNFLAMLASDAWCIVEVGCHKGRSTRALADNAKGIVYAVDTWEGDYPKDDGTKLFTSGPHVYAEFWRNLKDLNNVLVFKGTLQQLQAVQVGVKPDLIFIDGDHRYGPLKNDIKTALEMIDDNGIIAGHDYNDPAWPGVKLAVREIFGTVNVCETIWYKEIKR